MKTLIFLARELSPPDDLAISLSAASGLGADIFEFGVSMVLFFRVFRVCRFYFYWISGCNHAADGCLGCSHAADGCSGGVWCCWSRRSTGCSDEGRKECALVSSLEVIQLKQTFKLAEG